MERPRLSYHLRVMGAAAVVLLLTIGLVRWWPTWPLPDNPIRYRDRPTERIQIREITPTNQSQEQNPPPPAPLPPIVVPNDVIIEKTIEIGESSLQIQTPGEDERRQEGTSTAPTAARQPDTDARLLRNVQPNYPAAARNDEVRARIEIEVKIAKNGRVTEATVRRRWLLSEGGTARAVPELGHGLEEAALAAAQRSLFRPARANGQPVPTRKIITFTFGRN
ncbi:MAG TPA: hypothetical protein VJ884_06760 [Salinibacter sp.]|nr:hypothetical protein [Salinibacter sp.]